MDDFKTSQPLWKCGHCQGNGSRSISQKKILPPTILNLFNRGLPEPPVDVEVSEGPSENTLVISWLPVTINPSGTSNGAPVTGYAVYLDGKRVKDVEPGTVDQAIVDVSPSFIASPKFVAVRTKSGDKLSNESLSVLVPLTLRNKINSLATKKLETSAKSTEESRKAGLLTDTNNGGARPKDFAPGPALMVNYSGYPELDSDIGPSELSDIAEEPEEGLTDSEDDRSTPHYSLPSQHQNEHRRKPSSDSVTSLNRWSKNGSENNLHLSSAM